MTLFVLDSYENEDKTPDGEAVVIPFSGSMPLSLLKSALKEIEEMTGYGGFAARLTRVKIKEKKK